MKGRSARASSKGLLGTTLRYPYEVRDATDYFGDLPDLMIGLAPTYAAIGIAAPLLIVLARLLQGLRVRERHLFPDRERAPRAEATGRPWCAACRDCRNLKRQR
jgi:hypothetical protein